MMDRRKRELRRRLDGLATPPHRPGFWDDVEDEMEGVVDGAEEVARGEAGDLVRLRVPEPQRLIRPWRAAATAAVVVLVLGVGSALLLRPSPDVDSPSRTTAAVAQGAPVTVEGGSPPWSAAPLTQRETPRILAQTWRGAANQRWCSAVIPAGLGAEAEDAVPRAASFPDGWGVAWDRGEGPGQLSDATDCPDCGRSAFGIAGTAMVASDEIALRRPTTLTWSDGSRAGYGGEGLEASTQRQSAEVVVEGQGCVYEVWSNLGEEHLITLVESLRLVEGLEAPPVELRRPGDPQEVTDRGPPPWSASPVARSSVPELMLEQAEAAGADPVLVIADLNVSDIDRLGLRTWDDGVAWDAPDGAGHDVRNRPCADCGRGVIGLGWRTASATPSDEVSLPYRIEWDDGSYAEYGSRTADPALPLDRVVFFDPETGARAPGAFQAIVRIAGTDHDLVVWTHLGERHLLRLLDAVRLVEEE